MLYIDPSPEDLQNYGIDPSGPIPEVQHQVSVAETLRPLNDSERQHFLDGLQDYRDSDYGLQQYCAAKHLLSEILQLAPEHWLQYITQQSRCVLSCVTYIPCIVCDSQTSLTHDIVYYAPRTHVMMMMMLYLGI